MCQKRLPGDEGDGVPGAIEPGPATRFHGHGPATCHGPPSRQDNRPTWPGRRWALGPLGRLAPRVRDRPRHPAPVTHRADGRLSADRRRERWPPMGWAGCYQQATRRLMVVAREDRAAGKNRFAANAGISCMQDPTTCPATDSKISEISVCDFPH